MAAQQNGAFRYQDGQVVAPARPDLEPHAQFQWDHRCPAGWEGYSVRIAWREAEDLGWLGRGKYGRRHEPSGMVLVAQWGFLSTAYPAYWDFDDDGERVDATANHGRSSENDQRES